MRHKAYKFRIYPDEDQRFLIKRTFGSARFVWNLMLEDAKKSYEKTKKFDYPTPASYKSEHTFLSKVDSMALCNAQMNLRTAFSRFFEDRKTKKKRKSRFPRFKSKKKTRRSYTTNCINNSVRIERGKLRLPKVGLVKTVFHRRVEGRIKSATVSQDPSGKYFVSILTEQLDLRPKSKVDKTKVIGLDFSFHSLFVTSTGARPKHLVEKFKRLEVKLSREKRRLSKKEFGSRGYEKQKIRVAKTYEYIRNFRKDFLHKCVKQILDRYDVVVIEDIDLVGMAKRGRRRKFGASIYRLAFGSFREILKIKAEERGKLVVVADRWFPSSQLCSSCGYRNKKTKDLSIREWTCPECDSIHDRDTNAAQNLVNYYVVDHDKDQDRTGALPGIHSDGDVVKAPSPRTRGKQRRGTRKSCRTIDSTSPRLQAVGS